MQIILASASPRRRQLLRDMLQCPVVIRPAQAEESCDPTWPPAQQVRFLALQKAREIAQTSSRDDIVIGADTLVYIDGTVLGKPRSPEEAAQMLARLSGRGHTVFTGVALVQNDRIEQAHAKTLVRMRTLTPAEIDAYVATGEPMDKAGAYGIQGGGALLVSAVQGDFYNVVGLPLCLLGQMLRRWGVSILDMGGLQS